MTERITYKDLVQMLDLIYDADRIDLNELEKKLTNIYKYLKNSEFYQNALIIVENNTKLL